MNPPLIDSHVHILDPKQFRYAPDVWYDLQAQGVVGIAMNAALLGVDFYADIEPLLTRLRDLGMCAQLQVQHDQLVSLAPMLKASGVKLMFDHCGRPYPSVGVV